MLARVLAFTIVGFGAMFGVACTQLGDIQERALNPAAAPTVDSGVGLPAGATPTPPALAVAVATPTVRPTPRPITRAVPVAPVPDEEFQAELERYLAELDGVYAVALRDLTAGRTVLINEKRLFPSASTYKLLVMYLVLQRVQNGDLAMDDLLTILPEDDEEIEPYLGPVVGDTITVAEALEAMITLSSNNSAYALVRAAGGWWYLRGAADEIGMPNTKITDGYYRTTAEEMLLFFEHLSQWRLLDEEYSIRMLALLRNQTVNDRIPALLPPEAAVAHKTGELPEVRNDAGIVDGTGGSFIICVLSEGVNEERATGHIAEIARLAYERYGR